MAGMYDELVRIKRYREQLAAQSMRREQQRFDQQARLLNQVREEVQTFHDQCLREEEQRFNQIRHRLVAVAAIEDMNRDIAYLREQEALLNQRVLDEEKQLEQIRQNLDVANLRHAASVRECEKFDQFVAVQRAVEQREQVMREEQELEEIASAAHQGRQELF